MQGFGLGAAEMRTLHWERPKRQAKQKQTRRLPWRSRWKMTTSEPRRTNSAHGGVFGSGRFTAWDCNRALFAGSLGSLRGGGNGSLQSHDVELEPKPRGPYVHRAIHRF